MQTPIGKGLCTVLSVQLLYAHIAQHLVGDMELSTEGVAEVKISFRRGQCRVSVPHIT